MSLDAQFQIRQNAMEMQEYLKDLFEWESSIKKKERAAAKAAATGTAASGGLPAPRGRAAGTIPAAPVDLARPALDPKAPKAPRANGTSNAVMRQAADNAAGHTYAAYSKWDRFDPDASDDDGEQPAPPAPPAKPHAAPAAAAPAAAPAPLAVTGGPSVVTRAPAAQGEEELLRPVHTTKVVAAAPPPGHAQSDSHAAAKQPDLPPVRNSEPMTPDAWRLRGNDLFKVGEYASARECYSRSVELQPSSLAYANRAMAHLKLSNSQEAIDDCTAALDLDGGYVKAYARRGTARQQLGQHLQAAQDFEEALRLEPQNKTFAWDRDAALRQYTQEQALQQPSRRTSIPVVLQQAAAAAAQTPSAPGAASAAAATASAAASAPQQHEPAVAAAPFVVARPSPAAAGGLATGSGAGDSSSSGGGKASASGAASSSKSDSTPRLAAAALAHRLQAQRLGPGAASGGGARCPKTSVEFEGAWRGMQGDTSLQASYLSAIPPEDLPSIFKSSMTAPVLVAMLRCLLGGMVQQQQQGPSAGPSGEHGSTGGSDEAATCSTSSNSSPVVDVGHGLAVLEGLTRVPRFDMTVMAIPGRDKQELRPLWDGLGAALGVGAGDEGQRLAALRPKYRL